MGEFWQKHKLGKILQGGARPSVSGSRPALHRWRDMGTNVVDVRDRLPKAMWRKSRPACWTATTYTGSAIDWQKLAHLCSPPDLCPSNGGTDSQNILSPRFQGILIIDSGIDAL